MSYCLNGHRCKVFWHWTSFILRNSPYMSYSMGAPTLLPPGLTLPRYPSVSTTPVPTYQVSSSPAWLPQYIMQPQMPHVSDFVFVLLKLWKIVVFLLTSICVCVSLCMYIVCACMYMHACAVNSLHVTSVPVYFRMLPLPDIETNVFLCVVWIAEILFPSFLINIEIFFTNPHFVEIHVWRFAQVYWCLNFV